MWLFRSRWPSTTASSRRGATPRPGGRAGEPARRDRCGWLGVRRIVRPWGLHLPPASLWGTRGTNLGIASARAVDNGRSGVDKPRSEEHKSELQSLMRISYAVFCLQKKKTEQYNT